eukprot:1165687-Rhodomonas_salina.1
MEVVTNLPAQGMLLPALYAMCGTDMRYAATRLRQQQQQQQQRETRTSTDSSSRQGCVLGCVCA